MGVSRQPQVRLQLVAAVVAIGLGLGCRAPSKAPEPQCAPGTFGVPSYDALLVPIAPFEQAPVFVVDVVALDSTGALAELAGRLEVAASVDPGRLSPRGRVALQNDVWGLLQRLRRAQMSSAGTTRAERAAADLVRRLALPPGTLQWSVADGLTPSAPAWLTTMSERSSELTSLQHERLYGYRRLFRIFVDGPRRALVSHLVAIDSDDTPYLTSILGDVEALRFEGDVLVEAHVHHLDRRGLRCGEPLPKVATILHIPADGANGFLVQLEASTPVADLPCAQCHRSPQTMSLPDASEPASRRINRLLSQLADDSELMPRRPTR